jgi:outer membrane protein OmpA-like peptidoglycan-associated protein
MRAGFFLVDPKTDAFSLRRAGLVKDLLVRRGIPAKIIQTAGRGRREPPIPTTDAVAEPRNRRVETTVR